MNDIEIHQKIAMEGGKPPPQATEIEASVLGAIMLDSSCLPKVMDVIDERDFYDPKHRMVFEACKRLYYEKSAGAVNILEVTDKLRSLGFLGEMGVHPLFVSQLTNKVASSVRAEEWSYVIKQHSMSRSMIGLFSSLITRCYNPTEDVLEIYKDAEQALLEATESVTIAPEITFGNALDDWCQAAEATLEDGMAGIPTGLRDYDRVCSGLIAPDLTVVGARPGQGKTAFSLQVALNVARSGEPVLFFTHEMSARQLVERMVCNVTNHNTNTMRNRKLTKEEFLQVKKLMSEIAGIPLIFVDKSGMHINQIRSRARSIIKEFKIKLVICDYAQLVDGDGENQNIRVGDVSKKFKQIAKDNNVAVWLLSQLSRGVESRSDRMPVLSDLRDSGSIEQDADNVVFLMRPAYYDFDTVPVEGKEHLPADETLIAIIAKQRNGEVGNIYFKCDMATMSVMDKPDSWETPQFSPALPESMRSEMEDPQAGMSPWQKGEF